MQAADEDSVFAELYGSNANVEPQSQAVVQLAIVTAAASHRVPAVEEVGAPPPPFVAVLIVCEEWRQRVLRQV